MGTLFYHLVIGGFRGTTGAYRYRVHVGHAVMRSLTDRLTERQFRYFGQPSNQAYEQFCKKKKFRPDTTCLKHGASGHWIGSRDATQVLIYFHGGGFQLSATPAYFEFFLRLTSELQMEGHELCIFFLTYTLTPDAAYPQQLRQSVEAVRYVVSALSILPEKIILGGDSAGGNLVMGVLSHITHPHPEIETLELNGTLAGAFTLSPWVSFSGGWVSEYHNRFKDIVNKGIGQKWSSAYLNGKPADPWNEPICAPRTWWRGLKIRQLLVIAGSEEILLSSIEKFVGNIQKDMKCIDFAITSHEGHVAAILDSFFNSTTTTEQERVLKVWLAARLSGP